MIPVEFVPTYEYECPRCPRVFEVRQRITAPALTRCDRCGGPIRRLLSATPFILKGGGWYVTDYPSEARKKAKGEAKADSGAETKADSGTESKASDSPSKEGKPAESKPTKSKPSDRKSSTAPKPSSGSESSSGGAKGD